MQRLSTYEIMYTSNENLFWYRHQLLQIRDFIEGSDPETQYDTLSDKELKKYLKILELDRQESLEYIEQALVSVAGEIEKRNSGISSKFQYGYQEPPWLISDFELTTFERNMMLGADRVGCDAGEMLKSLIWIVNDKLLAKMQYQPAKGVDTKYESKSFGEIKLEAIQDLNQPSMSIRQKRLLYLWRISPDWQSLFIGFKRDDWIDNTTKKKKTPRR